MYKDISAHMRRPKVDEVSFEHIHHVISICPISFLGGLLLAGVTYGFLSMALVMNMWDEKAS
jgi:hypothetical protein